MSSPPSGDPYLANHGGTEDSPGRAALMSGTLRVDDLGCVYLQADHVDVGLIWPAGYTARRDQHGDVVVEDRTGQVVAREGHELRAGGGGGPQRRGHAEHCPVRPDAVFSIHHLVREARTED